MQLNLKHRAVLGAFTFYTRWTTFKDLRGLQARHIHKLSPRTFDNLWRVGYVALGISNTCKALVKAGLMVRVGEVYRPWTSPRGVDCAYKSPVFAPTDYGLMLMLNELDLACLPLEKDLQILRLDIRKSESDSYHPRFAMHAPRTWDIDFRQHIL